VPGRAASARFHGPCSRGGQTRTPTGREVAGWAQARRQRPWVAKDQGGRRALAHERRAGRAEIGSSGAAPVARCAPPIHVEGRTGFGFWWGGAAPRAQAAESAARSRGDGSRANRPVVIARARLPRLIDWHPPVEAADALGRRRAGRIPRLPGKLPAAAMRQNTRAAVAARSRRTTGNGSGAAHFLTHETAAVVQGSKAPSSTAGRRRAARLSGTERWSRSPEARCRFCGRVWQEVDEGAGRQRALPGATGGCRGSPGASAPG